MTDIDAIIIGAGVIGLATARELAMRGLSVIILESEKEFGSATSSRSAWGIGLPVARRMISPTT